MIETKNSAGGATCDYACRAAHGEPCWGRVEEIKGVDDNFDLFVLARACQGHAVEWLGGEYVEPPKGKP